MILSTLKHKITLFILLWSTLLYSSVIDINQTNISLLEQSSIYLDDKNLSLEEIINKDYFKPYSQSNINIGASKQTVWVKLTFHNNTQERINKIILIYSIFLENITMYNSIDLSHPIRMGQAHISQDKKTIYDFYPVSLLQGESKTIYMKGYSHYVPLRFLLTLQDKKTYLQSDYVEQAIAIFLIGFIFSLMLYSLLLSVFIKDKSYFFYSVYLFILLYDQSRFVGVSHLFFSETLMLFDLKITITRIYLLIIASSLFTIHFLNISKFPRIYNGYMLLIGLSIFALIFLDNTQKSGMNLAFILILIISIYNLYTGVYAYLHGRKQARLYIFGFGIVFITYIVIIMDIAGIISITQEFQNMLLWTTALEALILSLAFADRYVLLQKEKETISTQYLIESQNREVIIETEVKNKTTKLNEAIKEKELLLEEVHHRVKNNLHIILSIIQLQQNDISDIESKMYFIDLENRINTIAKTYDMLIINNAVAFIDMESYISQLLEDIQDSFTIQGDNIRIQIISNATLPLKEAVYVGLIINELVTNAYKYAFTSHQGSIEIILSQIGTSYTLTVKDDGVGFNEAIQKKSIGTQLIYTLVEEQLSGTLNLNTQGGTSYTINFTL